MSEKKGVLLLAFGGADKMENVEPFIKKVMEGRPMSPDLIEFAKERYELIGGSSPLRSITEAQAKALEEELNKDGDNYEVFVGMLNWDPSIKVAVQEMADKGIKNAIAIVMAPHSSPASTGGYNRAVAEALVEVDNAPEVKFSEHWHTHPLLIDEIVDRMKAGIVELMSRDMKRAEILTVFTAHSLPKSVALGDAYESMVKETIVAVEGGIGVEYRLAFQSKGQRGEWLGPEVENLYVEARALARKGLLVVPIGFVADHVETLYDIDIKYKDEAERQGLEFYRTPSLNTCERFILTLADVVRRQTVGA